jgi:hypothetical protein
MKQEALERLAEAKRDINDAEANLAKVLREIDVAPRAEKVTVSQVVQDAFAKVRAVRAALNDLEELTKDDP